MPRTLDDLDEYRRSMLEGDTLHVTDWARERARAIVLEPPVPLAARPLVETANFVTIALLPDAIREQYGFSAAAAGIRAQGAGAGGSRIRKARGDAVSARPACGLPRRPDGGCGTSRTRLAVYWGAGTRTPITSSRGWRLAIRRPPNRRRG